MSERLNTPKELESLLSALQKHKSDAITITEDIQQSKNTLMARLKEQNIYYVKINDNSKNEVISTITLKRRNKKDSENVLVFQESVSDIET